MIPEAEVKPMAILASPIFDSEIYGRPAGF